RAGKEGRGQPLRPLLDRGAGVVLARDVERHEEKLALRDVERHDERDADGGRDREAGGGAPALRGGGELAAKERDQGAFPAHRAPQRGAAPSLRTVTTAVIPMR